MIDELSQINIDDFTGTHTFLAEELMIPNVNKCDSNRVNMFCSHLPQSVVLKSGEISRVFTNFENQVGKYSSSYKLSDRNWTIISKIIKSDTSYLLIVKDENGYVDIIERNSAERITEYFGYKLVNDKIDCKKVKDVILKDEVIYHSTAYDDDLNFRYGVNLKTLFIPFHNMTFEDAIVISKSAAEKMSSYIVDEVTVNINTNDILTNIYGDKDNYKSFPDIGEEINNQILLARRRINYDSAFFDLSVKNLSKINYNTDTVFYAKGTVISVEVYSNADIETLSKFSYNNQILKYLKKNTDYYKKIVEVLEPIIKKQKRNYSDDAGYIYRRAKDIIDQDIRWRNDKSDFDNLVIKFQILKEQKLTIGSKLTGRYGNKGCVSMIIPDSEMPETEDGERAEICLNPLGIINRLNIAQLYEQELNFISNYIVKKMKNLWDLEKTDEMTDLFFGYIYNVNPVQHESLVDYYNNLNDDETYCFWMDIFEKGIFIHQPPFYGNITFEKLKEIYSIYPECKPLKFKNIENPLIMGELYFMKLKHEAASKFSARSSSYLNLKNIPSKSTRFKESQQLYPKTPIKLGEMEVTNLTICNDIDTVVRLMSMYSTNEDDRHTLINTLLTKNIFDINKIESSKEDSKTRQILDVYLKSIGLKFERTSKKKNN